jgi:hypothetical protein
MSSSIKTARQLKSWRLKKGFTCIELAKLLGVHHHTVRRAEKLHPSRLIEQLVDKLNRELEEGLVDINKVLGERRKQGRPKRYPPRPPYQSQRKEGETRGRPKKQ